VTAELKVSSLLGQMTERHPQVLAAREEATEIAQRMHEEVSVALRGIEANAAQSHGPSRQDLAATTP